MSLTNEERQTLVQRELNKAHEAYEDIGITTAADFIQTIERLIIQRNKYMSNNG